MEERRKHPRTSIHFPVYFICMDDDGNQTMQGIAIILNISESGILMESSYPLPSAGHVKIMASTKDKYAIEVKGKVVYSITTDKGEFRIGISFQDASNDILKFTKTLTDGFQSK